MNKRNILRIAVSIIVTLAIPLVSACARGSPVPTPTPTPTATPASTIDASLPMATGTIPVDAATNVVMSDDGDGIATTADTAAPAVSSTTPGNSAMGVAVNCRITATFSEAMDPLTLTNITFTLRQGTTPISGMVTYYGKMATFTPSVDLATSLLHTATITTGAKDLEGNVLASNYVWTFTPVCVDCEDCEGGGLGAGRRTHADTTPPTVISTIPADAEVGVPLDTAITATFSEVVDDLTVTDLTFIVSHGGTPVSGVVTYAGVTATFTPDAPLLEATTYTATITTGVEDPEGNALAADYVWSFTSADTTPPTVISTIPADAEVGVSLDTTITATFSEVVDDLTVTDLTFIVSHGGTPVSGVVTYAGVTATFTPDAPLLEATTYTATITTGVEDPEGNALAADYVWSFTTAVANPTAPDLGEAGRFVILASQAVTTTGTTAISDGDIAILDQARSYYAGFTPDGSAGDFTQLTNGTSFASDDANPDPFPYPLKYATPVVGEAWATTAAMITQVRTDLGIAYDFLAADPNPTAPTQVCPIELGGLTLAPGVYKTAENVTIQQNGVLHLDAQGDSDAVWIFSIDGTLTTGAPFGSISLDNGALAKNVYWRVAGVTTIGAGTAFYGNVFNWAQINVLAGATVIGRLFSANEQVTLIADAVTKAP